MKRGLGKKRGEGDFGFSFCRDEICLGLHVMVLYFYQSIGLKIIPNASLQGNGEKKKCLIN